ncbi:MAG: FtsH protease activity modulator HflK [Thermoflexaceae bacterium]|nr:FtsH protease activity modulator HflK [Thermoflexaceae bacterium]
MEDNRVVNGKAREVGKKSGSVVKFIVIGIIVGILILDSFYTINEQEQAVLTTFGVAQAVTQSGLHFKIPLVQQVEKVNTTIKGIRVGYDANGNSVESESVMITSDYNFVNVDFYVEYRFSDPIKAVYASEEPEEILKNIAQSCIRRVIGQYSVDDVLTTGKAEIQANIKQEMINELESNDIGVTLVNITIQDSEPPTAEVMEAFKAVETAKQGKETTINNANKYANEKIPEAEAKVDQILKDAEAAKTQRVNEANAEVALFNAMYEEYIKNPEITKRRMYFETMENVLPGAKVIVTDDATGVSTVLPLDSFSNVTMDNSSKASDSTTAGLGSTGSSQTTQAQ